jgi:LuxR family maltose regulon positive regulatory protein
MHHLSPRERQVLRALYEGQRPVSIAAAFGTSVATVRSQIRSIHSKLHVSSTLEAVALWHRGEAR